MSSFFQVWFSNRRAKWRRNNRSNLFRPFEPDHGDGSPDPGSASSPSPPPASPPRLMPITPLFMPQILRPQPQFLLPNSLGGGINHPNSISLQHPSPRSPSPISSADNDESADVHVDVESD